ncbi:MAG: flavin reductase family protein [Candidatus Caenarcaniphilales bacterium]|nr:flavin reductase family protein [Candidatus Caenarcaniphilales bacterium]
MRSLFKLMDYLVHAVSTAHNGKLNANIATWVMQSAMQGRYLSVALYKVDYTIELVEASGILNINFLAEDQLNLINKLGRRSGRNQDKFKRLDYGLDGRGCPYLSDSIGFIACEVEGKVDSGDHRILVCRVLSQKILNPEKAPLSLKYLRERGLVRG